MRTLTKSDNSLLNLTGIGIPSLFSDDFFTPSLEHLNQPKTNIEELDDKYLLLMELPGYIKENLIVEFQKNYLIISSSFEEEKEHKNYTLKEFRQESFERRFYFDANSIDLENINATFQGGILKVELLKTKKQLKQLIEIK